MSFYAMNIDVKIILFCFNVLNLNCQANSLTNSATDCHNTILCVLRLANTESTNLESLSIFLFGFWHIRIF